MSGRKLWDGLALFTVLSVVVTVSVLQGCGSSNTPTPIPSATPTPTPTVQTVVSTGSGSIPVRILVPIPFTTTAAGRLDVTVDWTFATNDLDVYLARGACSFDQFVTNQCTLVTFSESRTAKPERLAFPGAAAGSYVLLVGNRGPADESAAFQVVLTTGPGASSASAGSRSVQPSRTRDYEGFVNLDRR